MKTVSILALFSVLLFSCNVKRGSGDIISQTKRVSSFSQVSVSGPFKVEIRNGERKVEVEADDNLMKYVDVSVSGSTLRVKAKRKNFRNAHLVVYIQNPVIEGIKASMAAEISTVGQLRSSGQIILATSSAAEIKAEVDAPRVSAKASSGSVIELRGRTRDLEVSSSSGSDIKASQLNAENTDASASSGSDISVHASQSLNASASSGATIRYRGGGRVTQSASSGADIVRMD